jgi:hypothetical protein
VGEIVPWVELEGSPFRERISKAAREVRTAARADALEEAERAIETYFQRQGRPITGNEAASAIRALAQAAPAVANIQCR